MKSRQSSGDKCVCVCQQLPPRQEYRTQEVDNVVEECNAIVGQVMESGRQPLTVDDICR